MDEIEIQIMRSCQERGVCYFVPLMRYQIDRDQRRYRDEWNAHIARLSKSTSADSGCTRSL